MSHNSNLALQVSDFPLKYLFVFKLYRHLSQNPGVIHDISIFLHIQYQGMSLLFLVDMEFITWTFSASFSLENCPSLSLRSTFLCVFLFPFYLLSFLRHSLRLLLFFLQVQRFEKSYYLVHIIINRAFLILSFPSFQFPLMFLPSLVRSPRLKYVLGYTFMFE